MKILIGGGTGFIGRHLRHALETSGHEVTLISRTAGQKRITWSDVGRFGLPKGCSAVVNLAGQNILDVTMQKWVDLHADVRASRIDSNRTLVKAISQAEHKPKVFVNASAIGYYPPCETTEYTESSPGGGDHDFATRLVEDWEASGVLPADIGVRQATVRIGIALGRDGGMIKNLYIPFFFGLGGKIGSGKQWLPWIHVDDVAGIFQHAIEHDDVSGVLNAVSPMYATNAEFAQAFGQAMWRPSFFPTPGFAVNLIFGPERGQMLLHGQKVIPERTLQSGYVFKYPDLTSACKECSTMVAKAIYFGY